METVTKVFQKEKRSHTGCTSTTWQPAKSSENRNASLGALTSNPSSAKPAPPL